MPLNVFRPAGVEIKYNVKMPMRDGVELSGDIYLPCERSGPIPAILSRTPYDNMADAGIDSAIYFAQHGYAYILQDVRGRNDSNGDWYPWVNEFQDGHDSVEWIGSQEWCDGNVGMDGSSYVGNVQWFAAAEESSYLKCIAPRVIGDNLHEAPHYQGGAFLLGFCTTWAFWAAEGRGWQNVDQYNWPQMLQALPLKDLARQGGKNIEFYQDWLNHPDYDEFWKSQAVKERYHDIKIPVLQFGGWYDFFTAGTFNNFVGMRQNGGSELSRNNQQVVIGPWLHSIGKDSHAGDADFTMMSMEDTKPRRLKWFDHWLKNVDNGIEKEPPLRLWIMGDNEWRDENEWPLARTNFTPYYFHSDGSANTLLGDGILSTQAPGEEETSDHYEYNPAFPTPTLGGNTCCRDDIMPGGGFDQREVEMRNDVLVYTTEPLSQELEVTGPIIVKLYASTDGRDTDFTGKLTDVDPDGRSVNLCDGIIRGRYRETTEKQVLLQPGTVYEFTIDLWPTSNVFKKGHRIRVDISSSNFPRFDRNPNTGDPFGENAELRVAHQQIFHNSTHPSHIILPIIPRA